MNDQWIFVLLMLTFFVIAGAMPHFLRWIDKREARRKDDTGAPKAH